MSDTKKPGPGGKRPFRPGAKPGAMKPAYGRPAGAKPAGDKPAYARPAGSKPAFARPEGDKPAFARPAGDKPAYARPAGAKPAFAKPAGERPAFAKPAGDKPAFARPEGDKPAFARPAGSKPAFARPAGGKPAYVRPAGSKPAFDRPAGDKPSYAKPAGARPASPRPAGDKPAYARPAGEKPAFAKPSGDKPAYSRPAGDKPSYAKPAGARPAFVKPAGERPAFAKPAGDKPAFAKPAGARPASFKPAGPSTGPRIHPHGRPAFRPAGPAKPITPTISLGARRVALSVLQDITKEDAYASLALDRRLKESDLSGVDKRLAANIVYGTLENKLRIDYALDSLLQKSQTDPLIRDILRLSAYQILFLDKVPDSAAVNEGVKLCKTVDMEPLSGVVNGVLRNLSRQKDEISWPTREEGEARYISILHSVPQWLVERLMAVYGYETALAICSFRTTDHGTPVRPNRMMLTDEAFGELLGRKVWKAVPGQLPGVFRVGGAVDIGADVDYRKGLFSIQGESSILAAQAMDVKRGMQVLDACAAPGGKAAYMAETMQGTGRIQAWDKHDHRVELIRAMATRLRLENLRPMVRDALVPREELYGAFDAVLLDAPCSGLGVMLEKPDVKYRQSPDGLEELVRTQKALLDICSRYVKKNGTLVYSTCSILPEENAAQIASFLTEHPDFALAPLPQAIPEKFREMYGESGLQLFAHRDGLEGFFIARLVKKGG